jgi:hypothetical protein
MTAMGVGALGIGASPSGADRDGFRRGCPEVERQPVSFGAAFAVAKRSVYGQRFDIQGQTYVSNGRNTQLMAAMLVENLSLVPGMRTLYRVMRNRCGKRTPYDAWAFSFHRIFEIVPDYAPVFVARTARGWYVF